MSGFGEERIEAFQRDGQVCTSFGASDGMDLVNDHRLHASETLARLTGEDKEQRLRGRDEDVWGSRRLLAALVCRSVARADSDRYLRNRLTRALRFAGEPDEWTPQVAFHIGGECLQRRDVQHSTTFALDRWCSLIGERVDRGEECCEGLARACRCNYEGVVALVN